MISRTCLEFRQVLRGHVDVDFPRTKHEAENSVPSARRTALLLSFSFSFAFRVTNRATDAITFSAIQEVRTKITKSSAHLPKGKLCDGGFCNYGFVAQAASEASSAKLREEPNMESKFAPVPLVSRDTLQERCLKTSHVQNQSATSFRPSTASCLGQYSSPTKPLYSDSSIVRNISG